MPPGTTVSESGVEEFGTNFLESEILGKGKTVFGIE
jgi:hypothetical protein